GRRRTVGGQAHLELTVLDAAGGFGVAGPGVSRVLEPVPLVRIDLRTGERVEDDPSLALGGGEHHDDTGQQRQETPQAVHKRLQTVWSRSNRVRFGAFYSVDEREKQ